MQRDEQDGDSDEEFEADCLKISKDYILAGLCQIFLTREHFDQHTVCTCKCAVLRAATPISRRMREI